MMDRLRRLQRVIIEVGLGRNVLALPAPKTLLIEDHSSSDTTGTVVFSSSVVEAEIVEVSRDLFASGHYNIAVSEAFKALDNYVSRKVGLDKSGTKLMECVFSSNDPKLVWSDRIRQSEMDEHTGYLKIYAGAMQGIRNPTVHEFDWVDNPDDALELLLFAQHLLRKAKLAKPVGKR